MPDIVFEICGIIGMICIVGAYYSLIADHVTKSSPYYNGANLVGGSLLLVSLMHNWNTGSVLIEIFWVSIAITGLVKYYKKPK